MNKEKKAGKVRAFNRENMSVMECCAPDNIKSYHLSGVLFDGNKTVATDGRTLVIVTSPADIGAGASKKITDRMKPDTGKGNRVVVEAEIVKSIFAGIKKRKPATGLRRIIDKTPAPGPQCCFIDTSKAAEGVAFGVEDDNGSKVVSAETTLTNFPNYEQVIPEDAEAISIDVNPLYLMRILKLMAAVSQGSGKYKNHAQATLKIYGEDEAIAVEAENRDTGQKAYALLMPLHKEGGDVEVKIWQDKKEVWFVTGIHARFGRVTIKAGKKQPNINEATELFNKEVIKKTKDNAPAEDKKDTSEDAKEDPKSGKGKDGKGKS